MMIRQAVRSDAAAIAVFLFLAMEEIVYHMIGHQSTEDALELLTALAGQRANQYSYEFTWIAELEGRAAGAITIYEGARLNELRTPVMQLIKQRFNRTFVLEDETQAGELYIDCIGVDTAHQGKGVGSRLLQFVIDQFVSTSGNTIGLLVDKANPNAKKLYLKHGFRVIGEKLFAGKTMEHLQVSPASILPGKE